METLRDVYKELMDDMLKRREAEMLHASAGGTATPTGSQSNASLHIQRVKNGFTVHCDGSVYVAKDVDALHDVIKQALVEAKLGGG